MPAGGQRSGSRHARARKRTRQYRYSYSPASPAGAENPTPPGVLNDTDRRVHVFLDAAFLEPPARIGVHPNDNTATVWLHTKDLIALIEEHGNALTITEL